MTTWANYLLRIRYDLNDTTDPYTWTDGELLNYANDGLDDYSQHFPREAVVEIALVQDDTEHDLPSAIMSPARNNVIAVELDEEYLPQVEFSPGGGLSYGGFGYAVWGNTLYLTSAPDVSLDSTLAVYYYASHTRLAQAADVLTIPAGDEGLLLWFITAKALMRLSAEDARQSRWRDEGRRSDLPLIPEHRWRMQLYREGIALRKSTETITLYSKRQRYYE